MSESSHIFDVTHTNFETDVLHASTTQPVLVDFWAPWCAPCRSLAPTLEKIVESYNGTLKLAKINTDEQMQLAQAFGIRSLPTVVLFKDGQMVDGFMGALPENAIREFLARHVAEIPEVEPLVPTSSQTDFSLQEMIEQLRADIAANPEKGELKLDLALALFRTNELEAAAIELDSLPAALVNDSRAKRLRGQLDFQRNLQNAPTISTLTRHIEQNPDDFESRDLLGMREILEGNPAMGLEQFLHILRTQRDWQEGMAKKRLIAAFSIIEDEDLVSQYRRKMAALLF